ncbi:general substrate transporter [Aspergillus avenaceus]|uniref:General substrate transporter n=1 Tax=Aspergillus avenaceus TaxID=36643 RepID=A0A5N6U133_ASPAV|nr:general substrate transporter [Aspergillus avenaceus]
MRLSPAWYQFLVGVFASLGSFLYGYDLGVIAEVIASGSFKSKFEADSTETGLVVSLFTAGAFAGAAFAGPTGDWIGRRLTISVGCVIFCLGGGLQTGARTVHYLYSGRFLAGLGVGFLTMIIPLYQAEICHPDIRGRVTSLQQFMLGVGSLCAAWISYGTYIGFSDTNDAQWQVPLGLQVAPAVFLGLLIMFFPESPRWLMDKGKNAEGLTTLAKLHAHGDENDPWVRAEYNQIQESIVFQRENEAKSYLELFTSRSSFRRLFLCCALQAGGQMTGVSAIQYYSVDIYKQIGIAGDETLRYQAINSIIALVAQFLCMMFIDRFGRRPSLIFGNLGNCLTFIIATILLARFPPEVNNSGAHWGFIIMTWLYNFSFSCTCGPLSWIIPAEVFDTRTRAKGVSIATMTAYAFNTMIGQVTPLALDNVGYKYYLLFVICNFTNAVFFWLLLPETKKLPLEEMNYLFSNSPWIVLGTKKEDYLPHDLEHKLEEQEFKKEAFVTHKE